MEFRTKIKSLKFQCSVETLFFGAIKPVRLFYENSSFCVSKSEADFYLFVANRKMIEKTAILCTRGCLATLFMQAKSLLQLPSGRRAPFRRIALRSRQVSIRPACVQKCLRVLPGRVPPAAHAAKCRRCRDLRRRHRPLGRPHFQGWRGPPLGRPQ